jgi:hypothetical protein
MGKSKIAIIFLLAGGIFAAHAGEKARAAQVSDKEFTYKQQVRRNLQQLEALDRELGQLQRAQAKLLQRVTGYHRNGQVVTIRPRRALVPTRQRTWELELPFVAFWEDQL